MQFGANMSTGSRTLAAAAVTILMCAGGWRFFGPLERMFGQLARRRGLAVLGVGLLPLALRALLLPVMPAPVPQVHDEFSYILAADTFAHGRLTNHTHPMADYFETMHELMRPSYSGIYPAAQGMMLAAGWRLFGHPWAGVWISVGLMAGAICWMLQGWVPPGWALFGAVLAAVRLGVFSYWMNSYWGGAVAAFGGALVLGAVPRLIRGGYRTKRVWVGVWLGVGLAILANSRPFEGLTFALALAAAGYWRALRRPVLWSALLILAAVGAGMLYYFQRVTGDPLKMPYVLYRETRAAAPVFIIEQPARTEPVFHYQVLRDFSAWELETYGRARSKPLASILNGALTYWRFFYGWLFTIPLLALAWLWKDRDVRRLALAAALFFGAGLSLQWLHSPHYAAPGTGLFFLLLTLGLEGLRGWKIGTTPCGLWIIRGMLPATVLILVANSLHSAAGAGSRWLPIGVYQQPARARMLRQLEASAGRDLVIVRYLPGHNVHDEWVYNEADIDAAPVVWARDMGAEGNRDLLGYFENRQVWLVEPDQRPPRITPYR
jgi:hypothetical protein